MKLPTDVSSFNICGHKVHIKFTDKISNLQTDGYYSQSNNEIILDTNLKTSYGQVVLWHEITHAILDTLGYPELSKNEEFVDTFAQGLYQVLKTLK